MRGAIGVAVVMSWLATGGLAVAAPAATKTVAVSPDGKLGVAIASLELAETGVPVPPVTVIELATGRLVTTLASEPIFAGESHVTVDATWSPDSTTLVWYVDGKWGSEALEVVTLDAGGKVRWQTDVRERAVQALLAATKTAQPKVSAAAKAYGAVGYGSWYRDGLAIEVRPTTTPPRGARPGTRSFAIEATSNPKELDDYPVDAELAATMTATLDTDGSLSTSALTVTRAGKHAPRPPK